MNCYKVDFIFVSGGQKAKGTCFIGALSLEQAFEIADPSVKAMLTDQVSNDPESGIPAAQPLMDIELVTIDYMGPLYSDDTTMMGKTEILQTQVDIMKQVLDIND